MKRETVSGSGISWAICKSAPRSRQTTTPAPHHSVFFQAGCPSCRPTNSVKELNAIFVDETKTKTKIETRVKSEIKINGILVLMCSRDNGANFTTSLVVCCRLPCVRRLSAVRRPSECYGVSTCARSLPTCFDQFVIIDKAARRRHDNDVVAGASNSAGLAAAAAASASAPSHSAPVSLSCSFAWPVPQRRVSRAVMF